LSSGKPSGSTPEDPAATISSYNGDREALAQSLDRIQRAASVISPLLRRAADVNDGKSFMDADELALAPRPGVYPIPLVESGSRRSSATLFV
jgi:hypothetical protein